MSEIGKAFGDINYYNRQMSLGMIDKLFFVDKLPRTNGFLFVDFGCADGSMIRALEKLFKNTKSRYIGYDISDQMIDFAKSRFEGDPARALFTSDWENDVMPNIRKDGLVPVLVLSSVIHEVYSYAKGDDIDKFWDIVLSSGFEYVIVRDMMISRDSARRIPSTADIEKIRSKEDIKDQLEEFEKHWGKIDKNNNRLIHFLLKYRWKINWKREVNENYLPLYIEEFIDKMTDTGTYRLDYFEKFRIKFIEDTIYSDFGIVLKDTTHIKSIFILK